jgi:hypothetical protein
MTMILNKQPDPQQPAPACILDREGLEQADRSLRAVRLFLRLIAILTVILAIVAVRPSDGASVIAIPIAFISWLLIEVAIITARACVAGAWALRKPDQPAPP